MATSERETGTVKWFNRERGFGFIARDRGEDIFVHRSAIISEGYRFLEEGWRVEFAVGQDRKGLQAKDVTVLSLGEGKQAIAGEREVGTVKWFDDVKRYGFIRRDRGGDVFVHYSAIRGRGLPEVGQRVEFTVVRGPKGLRAEDVAVVEESPVSQVTEFCPECQSLRGMIVSASRGMEIDEEGNLKEIVTRNYHCERCNAFVRSEDVEDVDAG